MNNLFLGHIFLIILTQANVVMGQVSNTVTSPITIKFNISGDSTWVTEDGERQLLYFYADDTITLSDCKFYISNIRFVQDDTLVYNERDSYHLIDFNTLGSEFIKIDQLTNMSYDHILFDVGIDSITNVSGAFGGDLDPTKGMYWTWQNGYINVKIEGKSQKSTTRNNEIVYHLGGYINPVETIQHVSLAVAHQGEIVIYVDLKNYLKVTITKEIFHIMSPSKEAKNLSWIFAHNFHVVE